MIVLKIIGAVTAVAVSYFLGDLAADRYRKRVALLSELKLFADNAARSIGEYKTPLKELALADEIPILSEYRFVDLIAQGDAPDARMLEMLNENEREAVVQFAGNFGKCFKDELIDMCRSFGKLISESLENAKKECDTKSKIYRAVPPLCVTSVIILLM